MNWKEKLQKAWENRAQIAEGIYHTWISSTEEQKQEASRRLEICQSNTCGYWDSTGTSDKLVVKGKPGCTACGCEGEFKVNCFSCHCTLKDLGQEPLWDAILTVDQDKEIREIAYRKQFEKPTETKPE